MKVEGGGNSMLILLFVCKFKKMGGGVGAARRQSLYFYRARSTYATISCTTTKRGETKLNNNCHYNTGENHNSES